MTCPICHCDQYEFMCLDAGAMIDGATGWVCNAPLRFRGLSRERFVQQVSNLARAAERFRTRYG